MDMSYGGQCQCHCSLAWHGKGKNGEGNEPENFLVQCRGNESRVAVPLHKRVNLQTSELENPEMWARPKDTPSPIPGFGPHQMCARRDAPCFG